MRKNQALKVIIHNTNSNSDSRSDIVNRFHAQVIERRLNQLPLTIDQKISVINEIIKNLRSSEVNGVIK